MILKNKTITIVLIVLISISALFFWAIGLDIPSTYTASELFSKMADILLKVGMFFLFIVVTYAILMVLCIFFLFIYALYHSYKNSKKS